MVRLLALAALLLAGCGGDDRLVVSAASSLEPALTAYDDRPAYSFAGSDELAAQIRQGVKPDVYAAANTTLPFALFREGLVGRPVVFAAGRLVIAVAANSPAQDLPGVTTGELDYAIGAEGVPIGDYTRDMLGRLGDAGERILAGVRSNEPDVAGIVGKLLQGGVDAGVVYATDVEATDGALRAIELPARVSPRVEFAAAVVAGAEHAGAARAFVDGLREGDGRAALRRAGFELP